jgi:hypothetical protein
MRICAHGDDFGEGGVAGLLRRAAGRHLGRRAARDSAARATAPRNVDRGYSAAEMRANSVA